MNIRNLKSKLTMTLIGLAIAGAWGIYAIYTRFNFIAFITNPTVISILLIVAVPFAFFIADYYWGDK